MSARHGTPYGYNAGCRQACCRAAIAAYRREAYRSATLWTDAAPATARVRELRAAGATMALIGELTGLSPGTLYPLEAGRRRRTGPHIIAAVLAVEPWMLGPATPAGGTAEALRLVRGGRTLADAAAAVGVTVGAVTRAAERSSDQAVRLLVADAVRVMRADRTARVAS